MFKARQLDWHIVEDDLMVAISFIKKK